MTSNYLSTVNFADEVRAALDVSLTADRLPDASIQMRIYAGAALSEALRSYPDAVTALDHCDVPESGTVRSAVVLLTAALIAPAVPQIAQSRNEEGLSIQMAKVDWDKRAEELKARAGALLAGLAEDNGGTTNALPSMFGLARGRRGA